MWKQFKRLIEDEFYSRETFFSKQNFINKATTNIINYNFFRKNSIKPYPNTTRTLPAQGDGFHPTL